MIHIRMADDEQSGECRFACGIGPDLPPGDQFYFAAETSNPFTLHKVDCPKCNPNRGERPHAGTPLSQISGRPGHPGYDRFVEIARSWGYD